MEEMWLARNSNGSLYLWIGKPTKGRYYWYNLNGTMLKTLPRSAFPEVKWSDKEPTKVKLVIDK